MRTRCQPQQQQRARLLLVAGTAGAGCNAACGGGSSSMAMHTAAELYSRKQPQKVWWQLFVCLCRHCWCWRSRLTGFDVAAEAVNGQLCCSHALMGVDVRGFGVCARCVCATPCAVVDINIATVASSQTTSVLLSGPLSLSFSFSFSFGLRGSTRSLLHRVFHHDMQRSARLFCLHLTGDV